MRDSGDLIRAVQRAWLAGVTPDDGFRAMSDQRPTRVEVDAVDRILDDFFVVEAATIRHERFDGSMSEPMRRLSLERGDAAAAVIVNRDSGRIVMVDSFRYPTYGKGAGWMREIVAGMIEPGDEAEETIRREALEEVGYRLDELHHIGTFYTSPGGSSERVVLYAAEVGDIDRISPGGGVADEGEDLSVVEMSLKEVTQGLDRGMFEDAKTIIGLLWLQQRDASTGGRP